MSINRNKTLEDQIRKLKRDMNMFKIEFEKLHERFDKMDERFDGFETEIKDFKNKTGKSFLALTYPLKNQCGDPGAKASNELKEIWKDNI